MIGPATAAYQAAVARGQILDDPAQRSVLGHFDQMAAALHEGPRGWLSRRFGNTKTVQGIYLWGRVGRGKTLLTELFLQDLQDVPHQRWHFHRFMNSIHQQLAELSDTADTLSVLAKRLARDCRLLVLDEFFVSDIGDAMILYRLLEQLNAQGVSFVATSNVPPDELYLNGLQRASFLPCIALIKRECHVLELLSGRDYRLRALTQAATCLVPDNNQHEMLLARQYQALSAQVPRPEAIIINERAIHALALSTGVAWFSFSELCQGPRSAADYIEIARDFHTVLISGVPRFDADSEDAARRFVYLIDELYDRHVNLLMTAAVEPMALYSGHRLKREFERTVSRLIEMQSEAYLALEHRP